LKQKALIISLFLVLGIVFSNLLTISSLSLAKEIKSKFSVDENLGQEIGPPPSGEGRTIKYEKGVYYKGIKCLSFAKEKFEPLLNISPGNFLKTAATFSPFLILILVITYFLRKHYKKKRKRSIINRSEIEEVQKQPTALENKDEIEIFPSKVKKRVVTSIQIHETRRLLQKWEAGLISKRMKREAETINEWFKRINGPIEIIPIYEKVRYGEKSCTEDELRFIKCTLNL
jgi:cbb3-type cytochrome oxidase subunit 3